ncbi:MAG: hypothetical protein QM673_09835, partial [Gordonia sp. (in: high G+C Gram-positive bacteria)]
MGVKPWQVGDLFCALTYLGVVSAIFCDVAACFCLGQIAFNFAVWPVRFMHDNTPITATTITRH